MAKKSFDLAAGEADSALKQLSIQAGVEVIYSSRLTRNVTTNRVKGDFTAKEAIDLLLAGTGLVSAEDAKSGSLTVRKQTSEESKNDTKATQDAAGVAGSESSKKNKIETSQNQQLMKRNKLLAALATMVGLSIGQPSSAQSADTGSVEGRVRSAVTSRYLNNARVTVAGTQIVAFTDAFGYYRIGEIPSGNVEINVFFSGLVPQSAAFSVGAGQVVQRDFSLTVEGAQVSETVKLDTFMVAASREMTGRTIAINEQRFAPNLKNVVAADEFGDVPDGSVGEFMKFLPGITANYTANEVSSITLRGLPPETTPVMVDGSRMATPSSDGNTRAFSPTRASINNIARVEISKSPTPDAPADSFGGSVNLISKSAFERDRAQFSYRISANASSAEMSLKDTPGPGQDTSAKIKPAVDFTYINPVSRNFGFTLTGLYSSRYTPESRTTQDWRPTGAAAAYGTATNPVMVGVSLLEGPQVKSTTSFGANADWRIRPHDVLSFGVQWTLAEAFFTNQSPSFSAIGTANTAPTSYGPDFTQGANGAGMFQHSTTFRRRLGTTHHLSLKYRHDGPLWKIDGGAVYSRAKDAFRDIERGYFNTAVFQLRSVTTRFDGISSDGPAMISTRNSAGLEVDWRSLGNYTVVSGNTVPIDSSDVIKGAHLNVARTVKGWVPVTFKAGLDFRTQERDTTKPAVRWNFVGPDKVARTADDLASRYDLVETGSSSVGSPLGPLQYPSPYKLWELYQAHPEWWTDDTNFNITQNANNSKLVEESVSAAYFRADVRLLNNRLLVVGGVRYERTDDKGEGVRNDLTATYQRNPDGSFVRDPANNRPVKIVADAATLLRLQYQERGAHAKRNYDGFYPSINATFNVRDNLLLRASYAKTIGRPDFNNIVPGIVASDPAATTKTVRVNNTGLLPWTANNYDVALEYYFEPAGVLSAGGFKKDISDFFGAITTLATPQLLSEYGLDETFSDYSFIYSQNVGDAMVEGVELNYTQGLTFLPEWARGLQVFANLTSQRLLGDATADFSDFIRRNINWGISLSRPKYTVKLNWNHRGRQRIGMLTGTGVPAGAYDYYAPRMFLDVNAEYRMTSRLALFATVRNITDSSRIRERYAPDTPAYASRYFEQRFGAQYFFGIKGTF